MIRCFSDIFQTFFAGFSRSPRRSLFLFRARFDRHSLSWRKAMALADGPPFAPS